MHGLDSKVVLVTGAAQGIGRAIAEAALADGGDVVACDLPEKRSALEELASAAARAGSRATIAYADVRDEAAMRQCLAAGQTELGPVDVLVNNAGIETIVPFLELSGADWAQVTDTNLRATWMCSQLVARDMVKSGRQGAIVNIGSVQAGMVLPGRTHYAPSKSGVEALTRNMAAELAPHGIRVNCVHPGVIDTPMTAWVLDDDSVRPTVMSRIAMERPGQPREVASVVVFLASERASYVTGQALYVDGGMQIL